MASIRPVVLGLVRRPVDGALLVQDTVVPGGAAPSYRLLGGEIHFGEGAEEALRRSFRDAVAVDVREVTRLGTLDHRYTHEGRAHHDLITVCAAHLPSRELYDRERFTLVGKEPAVARWKPLDDFAPGIDATTALLYPEGLHRIAVRHRRHWRSHFVDGPLITRETLVGELRELGLGAGATALCHSSLASLGWVCGGAVAVILALEEVLTAAGTLVMPAHSAGLSDPAHWENPPVPRSWWPTIRATMPAFDAALTPTVAIGVIPETFRNQTGVVRSNHPEASFTAWGKHAEAITAGHGLAYSFGEESPLARVYELDGSILLIGCGHDSNTSLHLAEIRASWPSRKTMRRGAPVAVDGRRQWVEYDDLVYDDEDFIALAADYEAAGGTVRRGRLGRAEAVLIPQRELVDFGVTWLAANRS